MCCEDFEEANHHHSPCSLLQQPAFSPGAENVLKRMTIIGVILSFRAMAQEGLQEVSGEG